MKTKATQILMNAAVKTHGVLGFLSRNRWAVAILAVVVAAVVTFTLTGTAMACVTEVDC